MNVDALQSLMLNDNGFAFHPVTGESYQLSQTAISIIRWLSAGDSEEMVTSKISSEYEVDKESAVEDLGEFILTLKNIKLIE
jgi:PqqD family protein of HPr-rel-A system